MRQSCGEAHSSLADIKRRRIIAYGLTLRLAYHRDRDGDRTRRFGEAQEKRMAVRVVRLGSPRVDGEGLRLGTVRRPPRGVPKAEHASRDFYDVWLPDLAPSASLVKQALRASDAQAWRAFAARYRAEMKRPEAARLLVLLAALSHGTNFSVGCYCAEEARCHRSVLRALLREHGASLV